MPSRKKIPDYLTKEELEKILEQVDQANGKHAFRNRVMIEIMFWCGLRVSELVNIQVSNINWGNASLTLLNTKGGKSRVVPIKRELLTHLKLYLDTRTKAKYSRDDSVFLNMYGGKLTTRRVQQIIKRYADKSNINKKITPHTFRHSFATHCSKCGVDTKTLQQMLGHEWVSTTEIYLNHMLSFEEIQKAYEKVI